MADVLGPRAKLVATIGPASIDRVNRLVEVGMSVARVNLAHGDATGHRAAVAAVRAAADRAGRDVAVLADLPGPKIRLGELPSGEASLTAGRRFRLGPDEAGDDLGATASHPLAADLRPDDRVLLADGAAELRVIGSTGETLETVVERGGTVRSRAGVAVPSERLSVPALTPQDRALVPLLIELGVDFVGLSFVRRASDIGALRDILAATSARHLPAIVAKIETRPAVEDADEIVRAADAVMVARGDLGVELPFEEVPLIQKRLIQKAMSAERPVIVATQLLESMTGAPRPTRAEASDVANAALDGADAVMLSAETTIGAFPVEAAQAAIRILLATEVDRAFAHPIAPVLQPGAADQDARAIALAAIEIVRTNPGVATIACFTRTGRTARLLAALRPQVPIVALCPDAAVRRQLALVHGVHPRPIAAVTGQDIPAALGDAIALLGLSRRGAVVLVATTAGSAAGPNLIEVARAQSAH